MLEHIEEYLVGLGADIDKQSFNSAQNALRQLENGLRKLKYAAAPLALATAIAAVGKAALETVRSVAKADMEYQKLSKDMWITKDSAKSLKIAMDTMGVSMDDIAWIPELREQFFRLREEMQKFATPADAEGQLRYIREIGYDIQALFVRLKMFKEWLAYHLIKYLKPYIDEFKKFIKYLSDTLGTDMPEKARKIARAISMILSVAIQTVRAFGLAIRKVYDFIGSLPDNVKKWGAAFAAVGAIILAGPFGRLLAGLSVAMLLIEDFLGYMNGWSSSADLAPIWKALLDFADGTGGSWLEKFKTVLGDIADILDVIINNFQIEAVLWSVRDAVTEAAEAILMLSNVLGKDLREFLKTIRIGKPQVKEFVGALANGISNSIIQMAEFVKLVSKVLKAAALIKDQKFSEAWDAIKNVGSGIVDLADSILENNKKQYKRVFDSLTDSGTGDAVVEAADSFDEGYQWMDPSGQNKDPRNQCASFASQMMAGAGVDVDTTMNGDALAQQFKDAGAYHRPNDGYEPKPGDLIDWAHHVGIYAGNGEYIARNSSGGVQRGSMAGMERHFGQLWGFGSVSELQAAKGHAEDAHEAVGNKSGKIADTAVEMASAPAPAASIVSGDQEMAMGGILGFGGKLGGLWDSFKMPKLEIPDIPVLNMKDSYAGMAYRNEAAGKPAYTPEARESVSNTTSNSYGGLTVGDIIVNVPGTNAKPQDVANAVTDSLDHYWQALKMHQGRGVLG